MMHNTEKITSVNDAATAAAALTSGGLGGLVGSPSGGGGRTIAGRIHAELRRRIITGAIEPGERLVVDRLAGQFRTSITPIREALRLLERDGLIDVRPHCGATVCLPTPQRFRELYEVRGALEPLAVAQACGQLSDDDRDKLRRTIDVGRSIVASGADPRQWIEADTAFHTLLWRRSGNALLERMLSQLVDMIRLHRELYFVSSERTARSVAEHEAIVDALEARDADAAASRMHDHMRSFIPLD